MLVAVLPPFSRKSPTACVTMVRYGEAVAGVPMDLRDGDPCRCDEGGKWDGEG